MKYSSPSSRTCNYLTGYPPAICTCCVHLVMSYSHINIRSYGHTYGIRSLSKYHTVIIRLLFFIFYFYFITFIIIVITSSQRKTAEWPFFKEKQLETVKKNGWPSVDSGNRTRDFWQNGPTANQNAHTDYTVIRTMTVGPYDKTMLLICY